MHGIPLFLKHSGQRVGNAMKESPEDKRPVGPMPESADKKYDDNIDICTDSSFTASPEENKYKFSGTWSASDASGSRNPLQKALYKAS